MSSLADPDSPDECDERRASLDRDAEDAVASRQGMRPAGQARNCSAAACGSVAERERESRPASSCKSEAGPVPARQGKARQGEARQSTRFSGPGGDDGGGRKGVIMRAIASAC